MHRYEFSRNPAKTYLVERNRLMFVSTLWGCAGPGAARPGAGRAGAGAWSRWPLKDGWIRQKVRGWGWLWRNRRQVLARRRVVQRERLVPDRVWMRMLTDQLDTPLVALPGAVRTPLNAVMRGYWRVASRLV